MSNVRFTYLRDKNRNPHSCVAVRVDRDRGVVSYQIMTCHSADVFQKSIARLGARERLLSKPITVHVDGLALASAHQISKAIMTHIANSDTGTETSNFSDVGVRLVSALKSILGTSEKPEVKHQASYTIAKKAKMSAKRWLKCSLSSK